MSPRSAEIMWSYAQNFEDVMLARAFAGIDQGFYVDLGAWHPQLDSVTHHFYERGWSGINVEPNPEYLELLKARRVRDCNLGIAVGGHSGRSKFTIVHGTGMSTLDPAVAARLANDDFSKETLDIRVRPLNTIFAEYAPPVVHLLKIDCEGAETAILTAFDLRRFRPWIVLVEATQPLTSEPSHESWEPHLLAGGYTFAYFDGVNRFYVAQEKSELLVHFKVPPNVFDNFIVARMAGFSDPHMASNNEVGAWRKVQRLFHRAA